MSVPLFVYDVLLLVAVALAVQSFCLAYRNRQEPELFWCGTFFLFCVIDHVGLMAAECGVRLSGGLIPAVAAVVGALIYQGLGVTSRKVAEHLFGLPIRPAEWVFFLAYAMLGVAGALGAQQWWVNLAAPAMSLYLVAVSLYLAVRLLRRRPDYPADFLLLLVLLLVVTILQSLSLLLPAGWRFFPLSPVRGLVDEVLTVAYLGLSAWYFWSTAARTAAEPQPLDLVTLGREHSLSDREIEVMQLIATDKTYVQIGTELWIGESTVKTHARRIYQKLGVKNRAEFRALIESRGATGRAPNVTNGAAPFGFGSPRSTAPST